MVDALFGWNPERDVPVIPTLDAQASHAAANEGIARADRGADEEWKTLARQVLTRVARRKRVFTGDDVWAAGLPKPREPRALGPIMRWAMTHGVCRKTGRMVPSDVPKDHRNPHYEWESLIYEPFNEHVADVLDLDR